MNKCLPSPPTKDNNTGKCDHSYGVNNYDGELHFENYPGNFQMQFDYCPWCGIELDWDEKGD